MTRPAFRITYEITTHESAEHGDAAERGWLIGGGWHADQAIDGNDGKDNDVFGWTLRDALRYVEGVRDCGRWFAEEGERLNYTTGAAETRALHPPRSITPSSYRRLARLLKA